MNFKVAYFGIQIICIFHCRIRKIEGLQKLQHLDVLDLSGNEVILLFTTQIKNLVLNKVATNEKNVF